MEGEKWRHFKKNGPCLSINMHNYHDGLRSKHLILQLSWTLHAAFTSNFVSAAVHTFYSVLDSMSWLLSDLRAWTLRRIVSCFSFHFFFPRFKCGFLYVRVCHQHRVVWIIINHLIIKMSHWCIRVFVVWNLAIFKMCAECFSDCCHTPRWCARISPQWPWLVLRGLEAEREAVLCVDLRFDLFLEMIWLCLAMLRESTRCQYTFQRQLGWTTSPCPAGCVSAHSVYFRWASFSLSLKDASALEQRYFLS